MNTLASVACPYCWQMNALELDPVEGKQKYIEDCQVCCRPIELSIQYLIESDEFSVEASKDL